MMNLVTTVATGSIITEGIKTAFTTAVNQIVTDVLGMIEIALPPGLIIAGVFLAVGLGIKFFKSVAH